MDQKNTNSGNTFDKTIMITYNLFTAYKNDRVLIDFNDSSTKTIQLTSSKWLKKKKILKLLYVSRKKMYTKIISFQEAYQALYPIIIINFC